MKKFMIITLVVFVGSDLMGQTKPIVDATHKTNKLQKVENERVQLKAFGIIKNDAPNPNVHYSIKNVNPQLKRVGVINQHTDINNQINMEPKLSRVARLEKEE